MKSILVAAFLALGAVYLPATAADEHGTTSDGHKADSAKQATHTGRGKVVSVDAQAGTIKLTHEPIKSLKWPRMTMDFKANDAALLKGLKAGDQVDFELMKMDGGYHIMGIAPSKN